MTNPVAPATDPAKTRRQARYDRWVAVTARPLDILGLVFLVDFLAGRLVPDGPSWWQPSLTVVSVLVWLAFAVDYAVRLTLSVHRWAFVRTHPLDLVIVLVPMLRTLRALLLLYRSFKSISAEQIAGSLLSIVAIVFVAGAVLEWRVESVAPDGNIKTLGTAFWWAIVTTTTVGYGDTYPVTVAGRMIAAVVMLVGIGLIGTVSATVASWFVNRRANHDKDAEPDDPAVQASPDDPVVRALVELTDELRALSTQQERLRAEVARLRTGAG